MVLPAIRKNVSSFPRSVAFSLLAHPADPVMTARTCVLKRALEIERACYNTYGPETKSEYKAKLRSLYQNLKNKSNPGLRVVVLSGEVSAELLVVMTSEQLRSPEQRQKDKELQKRNMEKAMTAQGEKSVSTYFECSKCHEKEVSYTQAQTRSADEPMTTFCECQNCGHHWKVGFLSLPPSRALGLNAV